MGQMRDVYLTLCDMAERRDSINPVVLMARLAERGSKAEPATIAMLTDDAPIRSDLTTEIGILCDLAMRRTILRHAENWFLEAQGRDVDVGALVERIKSAAADFAATAQNGKEGGAYACVKMSSVAAEKVEWLWKPYLPLGKITLLDGWPGIGKSWLTCKLAAILTRGGGFPNGAAFEPGNVLMFSAEDGLSDTLRPRLDACSADVDKVIALNFLEKGGLAVFDQKGLMRFEATIAEYEPLLVIVDPLFAFTGGSIDIHRANECREVSRVLAAIAARQRCNLLCVRHLNKSGGNGSPMKAGIGSIDWLAAARVGLLAGCDPDDDTKRALTNYKNNLAPLGSSLGYSITFDPDADCPEPVAPYSWQRENTDAGDGET
jgi:hypothetical protein